MAVTWAYDGAANLTATLTGLTPSTTYQVGSDLGNFTLESGTTDGSGNLALTVTDVSSPGGSGLDAMFDVIVFTGAAFLGGAVASTVFSYGTASSVGDGITVTWSYDGANSVTATFPTEAGRSYRLYNSNGSDTTSTVAGDGTDKSRTLTLSGGFTSPTAVVVGTGAGFFASGAVAVRTFTSGVAGTGVAGSPGGGGSGPADPTTSAYGVSIAFTDSPLEPDPTWTRLDDTANFVAEWTVDRGRADELEQTDTGRATVMINDKNGVLDPSNASGPYYGLIEPRLQIQLARHNPVTDEWFTRFRGFIDKLSYEQHPSQRVMRLVIECVGPFAMLHQMEMAPGTAGTTVPPGAEGFIFYEDAEVNVRLAELRADAGYPSSRTRFFTGNIIVQETTYSPGESFMTGMQEAAEAEFPGVANLYEDRRGIVAFHGRFARFNPASVSSGTDWEFNSWKCGDGAAVEASISDTAQIRGITSSRGIDKIINAALAQPKGVNQDTVASLLVTDSTSIAAHGLCSWSADNLIIKQHKADGTAFDSQSANAECILFNTYYVQNFASAQDRIDQIVFRSLHADDPRATPLWDLLCRIDISDEIQVDVTNPGGGGFVAAMFFVEGVHEEERELDGRIKDVTLTLDVSPQGYFANNPFS